MSNVFTKDKKLLSLYAQKGVELEHAHKVIVKFKTNELAREAKYIDKLERVLGSDNSNKEFLEKELKTMKEKHSKNKEEFAGTVEYLNRTYGYGITYLS